MFGLVIIKVKELKRLRDVDEVFISQMNALKEENKELLKEIQSLTRKRDEKGRFLKK
ncbi:MAG: hypothetical protein LBG18_07840 [Mediterranea sp.]|jgi:hypothetical protein|nr:hypothetical protein [Mediterranea sp.]